MDWFLPFYQLVPLLSEKKNDTMIRFSIGLLLFVFALGDAYSTNSPTPLAGEDSGSSFDVMCPPTAVNFGTNGCLPPVPKYVRIGDSQAVDAFGNTDKAWFESHGGTIVSSCNPVVIRVTDLVGTPVPTDCSDVLTNTRIITIYDGNPSDFGVESVMCTLNYEVTIPLNLVRNGFPSETIVDCSDNVMAEYNSWLAAFGYTDLESCTDIMADVNNPEYDPPRMVLDYLVSGANPNGCGSTANPGNGFITVQFWLVDECGHQVESIATFRVEDTSAPTVINCPSDITVDLNQGRMEIDRLIEGQLSTAIVEDNCNPEPDTSFVLTTPIDYAACSDQTVEYVLLADDGCGNTDNSCSTLVTLTNSGSVTITCPDMPLVLECGDPLGETQVDNWVATVRAVDFAGDILQGNSIVNNFDKANLNNPNCPSSYNVTFTATDRCNNTETCMQTIEIDDTIPPVITSGCPPSTSVNTDNPNWTTEATNWLNSFTATDQCYPGTLVSNDFDQSILSGGNCGGRTLEVEFVANDQCNPPEICLASIEIVDNITTSFPTFPLDTIVQCSTDPSASAADYQTWINQASGMNSLGQTFTNIQSDLMFTNPLFSECGAEIEVTIFFLDQCNFPVERKAKITVEDTQDPVITCPADTTFDADQSPDLEAEITNWIGSLGINDNCGTKPQVNTYTSLAFSGCDLEITDIITFQVEDLCNNTSAPCTASLTIKAEKQPSISCPAPLAIECGDTLALEKITAWLESPRANSVLGDSLEVRTTFDINSLDLTTCLLDQEIEFTTSVPCGNSGDILPNQCITRLVISDTTPPNVVCPGPLSLNTTATDNDAQITAWLASAEFDDNGCQTPTLTTDYTGSIDYCNQVGPVDIRFDVQDVCGLMAAPCVGRINFNSSAPQMTCPPAGLILECGDPTNEMQIQDHLLLASGEDNSGNTLILTNSYDPATIPMDGCNESVLVEFITTDDCGKENSCQVNISIQDNEAPVYVNGCPDPLPLLSGSPVPDKQSSFQNWMNAIAISDCNGFELTTTFDTSTFVLDCDDRMLQVPFTLTDDCGRTNNSCVGMINITNNVDITLNPAAPLTVECGAMTTEQEIRDWLETANASDNLLNTFAVTNDFNFNNPELGECTGSIIVSFSITNTCTGLTDTETSVLTITDTADPIIVCPDAESFVLESPTFDADVVAWLSSVAGTDDCISPLNYSNTYTPVTDLDPCDSPLDQNIEFEAADGCGNRAFCNVILTITTDKAASVTCPTMDLVLECNDPDNDNLITSWIETANGANADGSFLPVSDNFDPSTIETLDCNGNDSVEVEFRITDSCGNSPSCTVNIIVEDTTPPTAICPTDLTINSSDPDGVDLAMAWISSNDATDNCSVATASLDNSFIIPSILCNMDEINAVVFSAEDACGLTDDCTATLTINQALPVINCPADLSLQCGADDNQAEIDDWLLEFSGTDNNDAVLVVDQENISITNLSDGCESASDPFVFRVTDICGKESSCELSIIQQDTLAPVLLNCPEPLALNVETIGLTDQIATWLDSFNAMDDCNNDGITLDSNNYNLMIEEFDCGDTQDVTFYAIDRCGNIDSSCVRNIDIFNELQPTIACPDDIIVKCNEPNLLSQINEFLADVDTFSLDVAEVTNDFDFETVDIECTGVYELIVNFTITDRCGNMDECMSIIEFIPSASLYIPTIFNPSGTGEDRYYSIRSNIAIQNITSFRVYDRWGDIMYEKENFDPNLEQGWNGRDRLGNNVQGVYVYKIIYKDIFDNEFEHIGSLTLLE